MEKIFKKVFAGTLLCSMLVYTLPILAFTNDEIVYNRLKTDGSLEKSIVSIKENDNVTQEEINKTSPIECEVTYTLNGEVVSAEEIAGKSGKITIKLDYKNTDCKNVTINGKNVEMYTPFIILTGTIIDNKNNKNIQITGGKKIEYEGKTIVIGYSMPGLEESLALKDIDLDIPSYVEIKLESTCFELNNIMSFATPKLLSEFDIDFSKIKDKLNDIESLSSASKQIVDGANKLKDGTITLKDGVNTLNDGAIKLDSGANSLKDGAEKLSKGAENLKNGTKEYSTQINSFGTALNGYMDGVTTLNTSYDGINSGVNQLNSNASQLVAGTESIKQGVDALNASLPELIGGMSSIQNATNGELQLEEAIKNEIATLKSSSKSETVTTKPISVTAEVKVDNSVARSKIDDSINLINSNPTLTPEEKNDLINSLNIAKSAILDSETKTETKTENVEVTATITADTTKLEGYISNLQGITKNENSGINQIASKINSEDGLKNGVNALANGATSLNDGAKQISAGIGALAKGSNDFKTGINTLSSNNLALNTASLKIVSAAKDISNGAGSLSSGSVSLLDGINTLKNGTNSLSSGTNSLKDGVNTLVNGTEDLASGIEKFDREGISKLVNITNDIKPVLNRAEKLQELSEGYKTFSSDTKRENITFISIMNSVVKQKEEVIIENKKEN